MFGLDRLAKDRSAFVETVLPSDNMAKRFYDLGIVKNTKIKCVGFNPGGNMGMYEFRGTVIAIRKSDSAGIIVREAQNG